MGELEAARVSPLYLPYISLYLPVSPLYLMGKLDAARASLLTAYTSPRSPLDLPYTSPVSVSYTHLTLPTIE